MNIAYEVDSDNKFITVDVPDLVSNDTFVIQMEYIYKNRTEIFKFYVEAEANVKFSNTSKVKVEDISASEKAYVVNLSSGAHDVAEIFENEEWFNVDRGASQGKIEYVVIKDGNVEYKENDTDFTLPRANGEFDGTTIKNGGKIYTILLKVQGVEELIVVNYKLYIKIAPTYVLDATRVEGNVTITLYDGEALYGDYIRVYNGSSTVADLGNIANVLPATNEAYNLYTLTADADTLAVLDANALVQGKIKLKATPTTNTSLALTLKYTTYNGTEVELKFTVVVRGITMMYSTTGKVTGANSDAKKLSGNIEITLPQDTASLDVSKYLKFSLSSAAAGEDVYAVLLNSNNETVDTITSLNDGDVYTIAYMQSTNGGAYKLVGSVGYTLTIRLVTA